MRRIVGRGVRQKFALWGALAAIVVVAGALVVFIGGGGGHDTPPQRLAPGGGGARDARAESVSEMAAIAPAFVYVAGDDLPALGGDATGYRLQGDVDAGDVRDLAEALGIEGDPTETSGSWHLEDGEMALDVYGADGTWSAYRIAPTVVTDPAAPTGGPDAPVSSDAGEGTSSGSAGATPATQGLAAGPVTGGAGAAGVQSCPGSAPGADNVVSLCEPPYCPTGPAADPAPDCVPVCLPQPDVANDAAKPCTPPICPQYDNGEVAPADQPVTRCPSPPCPEAPETDFRCLPPTTAPGPVDPVPPDPEPRPTDPGPPPTAPPTTIPPADLPSEDEARATALELAEATGADVDGAAVTVEDLVSMLSITVEPEVDGVPAPGLAMYVGIGDGGRIDSASGQLARPDELGDYPLIDTRAAIARLNEGWGMVTPLRDVTAAAAAESNAAAEGVEPPAATEPPDAPVSDEPAVEEQPLVTDPLSNEVEVTDAEIVLVTVPSWDESGAYLVPGYRFTAADESRPTVPAVTDDVLEPPPAAETPVEPGELPQPAETPGVAGGGSPGNPGSGSTRGSSGGSGEVVNVSLWHCGFDELRHGDRRWVVEDPPFDETNAPTQFVGKGTFTVDPAGGTAVFTDDSGIAVTFIAVDEDWEPPLCQ
jgi:hypothetical protein